MSDLSAAAVARFLQENPDFFARHADVFATLTVPHPYQDRAISLGDRQVMTLRDKVRALEARLTELIREAHRNEAISGHLKHWCQRLLAANATGLPEETITTTLVAQFDLQDAALRVWQTDDAASINPEVRRYAESLATPYCGNDVTAAVAPIVAWLRQPPVSFALIVLRREPQTPVFGLLVLGSDDPQRFTADMGSDFLTDIGQLASAALARA